MNELVVLGLSGGVDSAVAAHLLQEAGYRVHGLYLDIGLPGGEADARLAAQALGIPLTVADIRAQLEEKVCAPFAAAYCRGETPNPCILCNPVVKFAALERLADELGCTHIATGHYARTEDGCLYKGAGPKDQSYMLCRLSCRQVARLLLPLGAFRDKGEIRAIAAAAGLPVADKPDSMEICFIPDGDYAGYIERRGACPPPGNFVDEAGRILGRHKGIHHYTLGQRRGLGVAAGERVYVSAIRPETNEVVLSAGAGLFTQTVFAADMRWLVPAPEAGFSAGVKIRHARTETPARVQRLGTGVLLHFETPVRAPTPGQAAALYAGDKVLGGAILAPMPEV